MSVEYGQTGFTVTSAAPSLTHVRAVHCSQDGLAVAGAGATPVVYWSTFAGNARYGVYISSGAQPNLGDTTNGDPADDGMNTLAPNSRRLRSLQRLLRRHPRPEQLVGHHPDRHH